MPPDPGWAGAGCRRRICHARYAHPPYGDTIQPSAHAAGDVSGCYRAHPSPWSRTIPAPAPCRRERLKRGYRSTCPIYSPVECVASANAPCGDDGFHRVGKCVTNNQELRTVGVLVDMEQRYRLWLPRVLLDRGKVGKGPWIRPSPSIISQTSVTSSDPACDTHRCRTPWRSPTVRWRCAAGTRPAARCRRGTAYRDCPWRCCGR